MMKKRTLKLFRNAGRDASGQSVVESLLCSIIIMILLVGLLQVFHLSVAKLLTDYSAFRAARTYCVGFRDDSNLDLVGKSARVAAIGASGKLVEPAEMINTDPATQFTAEKLMIPEYLSGKRWWVEYEYWDGGNTYDPQYYDSASPPSTSIGKTPSLNAKGSVVMDVSFFNYPFPFLDLFDKNRILFDTVGKSTDLSGSSSLTNHASAYLSGGL